MSGRLVHAGSTFLGKPFEWWVNIAQVLERHGIKDADQLAFKLMARSTREERARVVQMLSEEK